MALEHIYLQDSEDILLPKDEIWPFLLRFPIGCYGISLGLSSQAILWRALSTSPSTKFLHISPMINFVIWVLALSVLVAISVTYALKCALYFEAVRREYFHPVRVNFFFAPWVVCMFLAIGIPTSIAPENLHPAIWCVFMTPILFLELKIYGQWLSGGKRRLCQVANPSSHLSVIGNFVGAILAAKVGWKEPGKFLWAVGFAHYLVVFVTLYQRLPTSEALPKELHPVYSMFIATPAAASIAWGTLYGEFDGLSRTCYFIALFLFLSLVVRINFFRGFRSKLLKHMTILFNFTKSNDIIINLLFKLQVFCGLVVLHFSYDHNINSNNQVCRGRTFSYNQGSCFGALFYVIYNGFHLVRLHIASCFCLANFIPQRLGYCHNEEKTGQGEEIFEQGV